MQYAYWEEWRRVPNGRVGWKCLGFVEAFLIPNLETAIFWVCEEKLFGAFDGLGAAFGFYLEEQRAVVAKKYAMVLSSVMT